MKKNPMHSFFLGLALGLSAFASQAQAGDKDLDQDQISDHGLSASRTNQEVNVTLGQISRKQAILQMKKIDFDLKKMDIDLKAADNKAEQLDPKMILLQQQAAMAAQQPPPAPPPAPTLVQSDGRDGRDGKDGKDGKDGRNGKGSKDDAPPPEPEVYSVISIYGSEEHNYAQLILNGTAFEVTSGYALPNGAVVHSVTKTYINLTNSKGRDVTLPVSGVIPSAGQAPGNYAKRASAEAGTGDFGESQTPSRTGPISMANNTPARHYVQSMPSNIPKMGQFPEENESK